MNVQDALNFGLITGGLNIACESCQITDPKSVHSSSKKM